MSIASQHEAVQRSAGIFDYSERGKVRVEGPDHVSFLHSMISHDVERLGQHAGRYGTFLTHNGRLICDFYFYKFARSILIDLDPDRAVTLVESLSRFIIMDDVEVVDDSHLWAHLSVQGPLATEILEQIVSGPVPCERYQVQEVPSMEALVINKPELAETGYEILLPRGSGQDCLTRIVSEFASRGVVKVDDETRNVLRMERGTPWFGVDMDESNYPMEAGLEEAISLDKGCFVGQEVVAKATYIGGVRRRLGKLLFSPGSPAPVPGAQVIKNGKEAGAVTSAVHSVRLQCPIALAYLIQARARPGDEVTVLVEGDPVQARVVDSF